MNKKLIIIANLLCFLSVFSQNKINLGLKFGWSGYGFHTSNGAMTNFDDLHSGIISRYKINKTFGVQGEILYNPKGGQDVIENTFTNFSLKLKYIDVPVLANIYIFKKLTIDMGASYGFIISKKIQNVNSESINTQDLSLLGGFTYKFNNGIFIQNRYGYGLSKLFDNKDYYNSNISLSIGYFFK